MLAAKILHVIDDRKWLPEIGKAARLTAEEKADWKKNFRKLLDAYQLTVSNT